MPDLRDSILKLLQLQGNTHPFAVVRFAELDRWATDGSYESILAGDYPRRDTDRDASFTDEVRNAANSYRDSWSRSEDPLAGIFRGVAETGARAASGLFDRLGGNRGSGSGSTRAVWVARGTGRRKPTNNLAIAQVPWNPTLGVGV